MVEEQPRIDSVVSALARDSGYMSFEELPTLITSRAERAGLFGIRLFLADRQQRTLNEVTGKGVDASQGGETLRVDGTVAGLTFMHSTITQIGDQQQFWVPVMNGSERLGVLYVEHAEARDDQAFRSFASIVGLLIVDKRTTSDSYARLIRNKPMAVSAEMQWTLMPPTTFANRRITVSGVSEPAYENAGDTFDFALAGDTAHLSLFDAMGHDNAAGLLANLTVGACRNQRRYGTALKELPAAIEQTLARELVDSRFTTGLIAELDTATGVFSWVNCGHLPPVVLRDGSPVLTLECEVTHPLGMDFGLPVTVCHEQLQPGDRVLMYTDGVVEARDGQGREFGIDRFTQFIVRHEADKLPVPETLRRLIQAVLAHHSGRLNDDATVLFCEWHPEDG